MITEELFKECCADIEFAYARLGHKFGWRFLTCPRSAFVVNPKIALVTLQPAGRRDYPELPRHSQEQGSIYLVESWDGHPRGGDPLQQQVRLFFSALASGVGVSSGDKLLAESLSSHFVPFRAPQFVETPNKAATLEFSVGLWQKILSIIHPQLIVVLGNDAFEAFSSLLQSTLRQAPPVIKMPTGWEPTTVRVQDFSSGPMLCSLPHLSRFKIFGRAVSQRQIAEIVGVLSNKLL
jgi:hypothetical protein